MTPAERKQRSRKLRQAQDGSREFLVRLDPQMVVRIDAMAQLKNIPRSDALRILLEWAFARFDAGTEVIAMLQDAGIPDDEIQARVAPMFSHDADEIGRSLFPESTEKEAAK